MINFSKEFLQTMLSKTDIVSIVEEYLPLKRSGREFSACCPFHEERTPSFTVSPEKQFFHCFGCQAHGNVIDFLMKVENSSFVESVKRICMLAAIPLPEEKNTSFHSDAKKISLGDQIEDDQKILEKIVNFYHEVLYSSEGRFAFDYLIRDRKLSEEILVSEKIGYVLPGILSKKHPEISENFLMRYGLATTSTVSRKKHEIFSNRILFPIKNDQEKIVAFGGRILGQGQPKYLNSKESFCFKKREILYGWPTALKNRAHKLSCGLEHAVLLVEGYLDCLSLSSKGYNPVVAGLGTAISEWHLRKILQRFDSVYVCYDADTAGKSAQWKLLEKVLPYLRSGKKIYFVELPQEEDPDSLMQKGSIGCQNFENCVKDAVPLSKYFFNQLVSEVDLTTEEGKAELVRKTRSYISKIPDNDFQNQLFSRLNFYVGRLDLGQFDKFSSTKKSTTEILSLKTNIMQKFEPKALKRLIALLLQNPYLACLDDIDVDALKNLALDSENIKLFTTLMKQAKKQTSLTLSQRLEFWRSTPYYTVLSELSLWDHCIDPEHQEEMFKKSLAQLLKQGLEQEVEKLLLKSKSSELNLAEKNLYLKLIKYLKKKH